MASDAPVEIRAMTDADCPRVSEVLCVCFRWLGEREGLTAFQVEHLLKDRATEAVVREEAKTRPHLVACVGKQVAGMAVVKGNELARLYVDPRFHRRGIGKMLFESVEQMIRAGGSTEMQVGALVESAAAFYRAMGMSVAGSVPWQPEVFGERTVTILKKSL